MREADFDHLAGRLIDAIQDTQAQLSRAEQPSLDPFALQLMHDMGEDAPPFWRAQFLQAAIEQITVGAGRRGTFEPSRLRITWSS